MQVWKQQLAAAAIAWSLLESRVLGLKDLRRVHGLKCNSFGCQQPLRLQQLVPETMGFESLDHEGLVFWDPGVGKGKGLSWVLYPKTLNL